LRSLKNNGYCTQKTAREVDASALLWEVTCTYDSKVKDALPPTTVNWEVEDTEILITHDMVTGVPITNSAGELIPSTTIYPVPVLIIERVESFFNPIKILVYSSRVNSKAFWGAPPGTVLLSGPTARDTVISGTTYFTVNYRFKFNLLIDPDTKQPKGWFLRPLNYGTKFKENALDVGYKPFLIEGEPTTGLLELDGTRRPANYPPIFLTYNRYPIVDFNTLGLI